MINKNQDLVNRGVMDEKWEIKGNILRLVKFQPTGLEDDNDDNNNLDE